MANDRGWVCPKCGRVYSPWVSHCEHCNMKAIINSQTANSGGSIIGSRPNPEECNSIDRSHCISQESM